VITSIKKKLWRLQRVIRSRLGVGSTLNSPDRVFQEHTLIPEVLEDESICNVLYVGVAWYTYHYYRKFFRNINLTTLDISRDQAVFGCRTHVTGELDSPDLIPHALFDTIFLFGVLNYGINDENAFNTALTHIDRLMTKTGCCYLTVEERMEPANITISSKDMVRVAEAMQYHIVPISDWFEIVGGQAKTRFFVLSKSPASVISAQKKFSQSAD